ncbi:MAG: hypothetical protein KatS3mg121_1369 [Gammaproteobacteria bacterium]|nr:MAG: hypothetical protein KatS3mg121_1369 [Gammaproteobacteria bacterium]
MRRLFNAAMFALALAAETSAAGGVVVVHPAVRGAYLDAFEQILEGIDGALPEPALRLVQGSDEAGDLREALRRALPKVVVALGGDGGLCGTAPGVHFIVGAVLSPEGLECRVFGGVALAPDPDRLFALLRELAPGVKRVWVLHRPAVSGWLMPFARRAAAAHGLALHVEAAEDLYRAAERYREWLDRPLGPEDAVWVPQDPVAAESTLLAELLKAAWRQNFVLFSSVPSHVQRGALFALYPDYRAMGRRLGRLAREALEAQGGVKPVGVQPLSDVLVAVNLRSADHLGLDLARRRESFDLVFPQR